MKLSNKWYRLALSVFSIVLVMWFGNALADGQDIGGVADTVAANFSHLAKLITAVAYIAGLGFAVASIFKFKAHKDNPTQVPIGTPLALLFIGAALIFMPTVFKVAGQTVFGESTGAGGSTGTDPFSGS